ncbi:uncharacterized protein BKA55DRAFT_220748 [Fusarium redolens]|uniref:Secreted protein n=1 Tax=Fusarium redolens TaxID=48865 RepID=A0A9P9HVC8_FUSRE|nr:uncharacterized protein BKA55DRAFT_220748 [Fusarium redolens]KAH7264723.1 hypothetical protein BKA55DRAFT_220748 [Fusarium redolens]
MSWPDRPRPWLSTSSSCLFKLIVFVLLHSLGPFCVSTHPISQQRHVVWERTQSDTSPRHKPIQTDADLPVSTYPKMAHPQKRGNSRFNSRSCKDQNATRFVQRPSFAASISNSHEAKGLVGWCFSKEAQTRYGCKSRRGHDRRYITKNNNTTPVF